MSTFQRSWAAIALLGFVASSLSQGAHAQLLYSFESGLDGWAATGFAGSDLISVTTSTMGATDGSQSLAIETGTGFGWDVNVNVDPSDLSGVYNAFNNVASNLGQYTLDFDVSITSDSFANVSNPGSFFVLNVATNSDSPGFTQTFNVTPNLAGLTSGTFPVSIPMSNLSVAPNSSFYQLNLGSNSDHTLGLGGEGVTYFVDNLRFTQLPVEETLFSWETPDNPATPGVNEQFENWTEGFNPGHVHSISSLGATDGSSSLQINRQSQTTPDFAWGSQFTMNSDIDPDPEVENIDPAIQGVIDGLVGKINGAQSIAFDVRFDDAFPNTPTFTKFGISVSDDQGTFFEADGDTINGAPAIGDTVTVTIPLSSLVDSGLGMSLADVGLSTSTNFLEIGISTNTDGAGIYQIDNFRVISEATTATDTGDFDEDGDVNGSDFLAWQRGFGATGTGTLATGDANGDSNVDNLDLVIWEAQFGVPPAVQASTATIPEPSTLALILIGGLGVWRRRRSS